MKRERLDFMDKQALREAIHQAGTYIRARVSDMPEIAVVLGSGLGVFADQLQNATEISFAEIPGFPPMTVEGHTGKLLFGELSGKKVMVMQGRYHYYEGYEVQEITLPIRVMGYLGIKSLVLTNACGGVNESFSPGDLMVIEDHLSLFCPSPLRGSHLEEMGPRFTDMSEAYHRPYVALAQQCAADNGIPLQKGVYAYWTGPTYETAAEVRAYKALGADVVGMSTVSETVVAVNQGIKVMGISAITNMTCAISKGKTSHEEVMEMGQKIAGNFALLLTEVIKQM